MRIRDLNKMTPKVKAQYLKELGIALDAYSDPANPEYDPEFDKLIRAERPEWFEANHFVSKESQWKN